MKTTTIIPVSNVALRCAAVPHLLIVVGFKVEEDSLFAMPITLGLADPFLTCGDALLMNEGAVIDLKTGRAFDTAEEMVAWIAETSPYKIGAPLFAKGPAPMEVPQGRGPYGIVFCDKTFRLTSNWHFIDANMQFVFQLPAETNTPKDNRVIKINRDDLNALKANNGLEELAYAVVIGDQEQSPQPEPEVEDEDDDLDSMI